MAKISPEASGWIPLHPKLRKAFSPLSSAAIEIAFNTGISVEIPPIQGAPSTIERVLDIDQTANNILANPTVMEREELFRVAEEERTDWARQRAVEIAQKDGYVQEEERWVKRIRTSL